MPQNGMFGKGLRPLIHCGATLAGGRVQNPHPLLVHFPIAFLSTFVVATLLSLVVRRPGLERFARACLFVGAAAAGVTVVSGFLAEQGVARVAAAQDALDEHRLAGYGVLALAAVLVALAVVTPRRPARAGAFRGAAAVLALALGATLVLAAHEGGELVHEYGVGTGMTAPGGPLHETNDPDLPTGKRPAVPERRDFR